jgi:hypothetical protein
MLRWQYRLCDPQEACTELLCDWAFARIAGVRPSCCINGNERVVCVACMAGKYETKCDFEGGGALCGMWTVTAGTFRSLKGDS